MKFLKSFSKYAVDDRVPFVFFFVQDGHLTDNEQNIESQQTLRVTTSKDKGLLKAKDKQYYCIRALCTDTRGENCVEWRSHLVHQEHLQ